MDWVDVGANALRSAFGPAAAVYALAAIGLNVHYGYTGLLNFGQVGFMLVGAYGTALTVSLFGLSFWLGLAISVGLAVLLALLLGVPTLRLRADYFAITTIASAEILRTLARSSTLEPLTGGAYGSRGPEGRPGFAGEFFALNPISSGRYGLGIMTYTHQTLWVMIVGWGLVALASILVLLLMRSPWGRVIRSIREDEDAARSLGKNAFGYKMQSLMVGGIIGALAGVLFTIPAQAVNADSFMPQVTFFAYTVLIMGGATSIVGPIVGSIIFWLIIAASDEMVRQAAAADLLPGFINAATSGGAIRFTLLGLALMFLMIFRPQGLFGNVREMQLDA